MRHFTRVVLVLAVLTTCGVLTPAAKADGLVFSNAVALQNDSTTRVDLYSHPGVTLLGPRISFLVDVTMMPGGNPADMLRVTYHEAGRAPIIQSFEVPLFGVVNPPFTLLFTIDSPGATSGGIPATLTIDLLQSNPDFIIPGGEPLNSYTYSFNVAQPVPEPASMILMGSGLAGVAHQVRRRRRKSSAKQDCS